MTLQLTPRLGDKPVRFPNRIREYRLRAGLSQKALGSRLGQGRKAVSGWERGQRLPTLANAFRLARALDTLCEGLYRDLYDTARTNSTADGDSESR